MTPEIARAVLAQPVGLVGRFGVDAGAGGGGPGEVLVHTRSEHQPAASAPEASAMLDGMLDLPWRAKLLVLGSVARASAIWAVPFLALGTSPWFGAGVPRAGTVVVLVVVPVVVAAVLCVAFPHDRFGDWATGRIECSKADATVRTVNLTEELGIATGGSRPYQVLVVASPIPNAAALPGSDRVTIVVTTGAEQLLPRDELQALLATQFVVASDRWVRLASAAQLLGSPRFAILFGAGFLNPFLIPLAFLAFLGQRRGDTVRDLVADHAALRATRHPDALGRALFHLRPAAPHANRLRVGLPGFLVDQYWVLSTRSTTTTSVSTAGSSRTWTTTDEIAAEMTMRADRIIRGARGEQDALFDLHSWKRAVQGLGTASTSPSGLPIPLTTDERATADRIGQTLAANPNGEPGWTTRGGRAG